MSIDRELDTPKTRGCVRDIARHGNERIRIARQSGQLAELILGHVGAQSLCFRVDLSRGLADLNRGTGLADLELDW